jgi:hypothetical protein
LKPPKRTKKPSGAIPSPEQRDPDQAWYWTDAWQRKEREAEEDLAAGRYKTFDTMEEFLADLDSDDDDE